MPPHVCGAVHVPHESVPPHPLAMLPQFLFCAAHVVGAQLKAGVTFRTADALPLLFAEMVTAFVVLTAEVVTLKPALV